MKKSNIGLFKKYMWVSPGMKKGARFTEAIVLHKRVIPWKTGLVNDKSLIIIWNLFLDFAVDCYKADMLFNIFLG